MRRSPEAKARQYSYSQDWKKRTYAKRIMFARWVLGNKCAHCGSTNYLQFDHKNPNEKQVELSRAAVISLERFLAEIPKCQLLCHQCHVVKSTAEQKSKPSTVTLDAEYDETDDLIPEWGSRLNAYA